MSVLPAPEAEHLQLSGAFLIPPDSFLAEFSPVRLTSPDCAPDYQEALLTWRSTPLVLKAQSQSEFPDHLIVLLSSLRLKRPLLPSLSQPWADFERATWPCLFGLKVAQHWQHLLGLLKPRTEKFHDAILFGCSRNRSA